MIDIKKFRQNFDELVKALKPRNIDIELLKNIKKLDTEKNDINKEIDQLNCEKNKLSKENGKLNAIKIKEIKLKVSELSNISDEIEKKLNKLLHVIPNIPNKLLKTEIVECKVWGNIKKYDFKLLSHIELGEKLDLFDFDHAINISGAGFTVYKGLGEKLFRALINFTLDENEKKGYKRFYMPVVVSSDSLFCTSQISKFVENLFHIDCSKNTRYLSPTGEVQLVNMYRNKVIDSSEFPIKLTTNTNCFRNESVHAGTESKGLIRQYQFTKTEIVVICKPEDSEKIIEQMCIDAEDLLIQLEIPYKRILLPDHDIGFAASKTYDLEIWFPSEGKYREVSSISDTLDFQARRGKIRYKNSIFDKSEKTKYVHILNGSSLAIDRLFAAIIENYQDKDGNILIPKALEKYLDFKIIHNNKNN